ncbi:MAG: iron-containing redox enzyme family protein [Bdellovibrio sp.]|nr:iron-containing redox enzyme family protein [Bdellovibrio sp.]
MDFKNYRTQFIDKIESMIPTVNAFNWEDENHYQMWLAQTYYIVRHTSHFICMAAALTPVEARAEHYHLVNHLKEEEHHDVFLVKDLASFGKKFSDFPQLPETELTWQNLYYWLSQRKSRSILGHSLCIEGLAGITGETLLKRLRNTYPAKALKFLELHFEADKDHYLQGLELIEGFDKESLEDIKKVQEQSAVLYLNMLSAISKYCDSKKVKSTGFEPLRKPA